MIQLGLMGYPLSHSLSPKIHTAALQSFGLAGSYSLFPIPPDDKQGLKDLLARIRSGEIHGVNVTIPHKQNVMPFLDELTPTAEAVGAVNTIYLREGKLIGDNTDAAGFLKDLHDFMATFPSPKMGEELGVKEKSTLVLGAGGSARAVVYALLSDGWNVTIAARRMEQAQKLTASFTDHQVQLIDLNFSSIKLSNVSVIVNTTPVGMTPDMDQSPLPENLSLPRHVSIYDLVYNPRETKLVKDARAQGLNATTGLGMLLEQAALSFELWTGCRPSREILRASVEGFPVS